VPAFINNGVGAARGSGDWLATCCCEDAADRVLASKFATLKISRRDVVERSLTLATFVRNACAEAGRCAGDDEVAFAGTSE
jgi:hypothetical protein